MGKIEVNGCASRKMQYDLMNIELTFRCEEETAAKASERVMRECEEFLAVLKDFGVDISKISLSEDRIGRDRIYRDNADCLYYSIAERRLKIFTEFNMKLINDIKAIIQKKNYQIDFNASFSLSKESEIHDELLREALKNAKEQAEQLAKAIDQKVVGLISADKNENKFKLTNEMVEVLCQHLCSDSEEYGSYEKSNELAPTKTVISENIYTVWEVQ